MRSYQTIVVLILIIAGAAYYHFQKQRPDPRAEEFVACYVDLALLHQRGDTTSANYIAKRDSILQAHGLTEQSLLDLKRKLNRAPLQMADIWDMIEKRLKERQDSIGIRE